MRVPALLDFKLGSFLSIGHDGVNSQTSRGRREGGGLEGVCREMGWGGGEPRVRAGGQLLSLWRCIRSDVALVG
jgi:hypothetical protein